MKRTHQKHSKIIKYSLYKRNIWINKGKKRKIKITAGKCFWLIWYFSVFDSNNYHYGLIWKVLTFGFSLWSNFFIFLIFKVGQQLKATIKCDNGKIMTQCFHSATLNWLQDVAIHHTYNGTQMTICFHLWCY